MRRTSVFIHVFVLIQLLLPIGYYTVREDQNDERFAWRMFSPVHMTQCETSIAVGSPATPVNLDKTFHQAWVNLSERGRIEVIEAMGRKVCRDKPGERVEVTVRCLDIDKEITTYGGDSDFCYVGSL